MVYTLGQKGEEVKEELGELHVYFIKIPLQQQKFLVVSVLSNLP